MLVLVLRLEDPAVCDPLLGEERGDLSLSQYLLAVRRLSSFEIFGHLIMKNKMKSDC